MKVKLIVDGEPLRLGPDEDSPLITFTIADTILPSAGDAFSYGGTVLRVTHRLFEYQVPNEFHGMRVSNPWADDWVTLYCYDLKKKPNCEGRTTRP